jgi:cobalt/nickel transport system permease protein
MSIVHSHAVFVHGASRVHRLPGSVKLVALALFVLAVVATPAEQAWAFTAHGAVLVGVAAAAGLPPSVIGRRLLIGLPFLAFALLLPFVGGGEEVAVGGVALSVAGLWAAWSILAKGMLCLMASVIMTATTPVPEVLSGLSRLRVPDLITGIAGFMIRYLDIIAGEVRRMRVAMLARGYRARWFWQSRPVANAAGLVFVRAHERGERVYDAMIARGYRGGMPRLMATSPSGREWVLGASPSLLACLVAVGALVVGRISA